MAHQLSHVMRPFVRFGRPGVPVCDFADVHVVLCSRTGRLMRPSGCLYEHGCTLATWVSYFCIFFMGAYCMVVGKVRAQGRKKCCVRRSICARQGKALLPPINLLAVY